MIRILLVPSSDYLGHPFPQRHNQIFERLNDTKGFEVHVARYNLFNTVRQNTGLRIHELKGVRNGSLAVYYLSNTLNHANQIRRIVRDEAINVIVLSNLAAPFAYTLLDKLSNLNIPMIVDLPDYLPTSATGNLLEVNSIPGKIITTSLDLMLREILKRANLVTVVSKALKEYAQKKGAKRVEIVPNGISECFLKMHSGVKLRQKLGYNQDDFVIGYVGSIEFWIDIQTLLRGISLAIKNGVPAKLMIVGKSLHTNYMYVVKNHIKSEGLEKNVMLLDFVPYQEVPTYMNAINVGTIPFNIHNATAYYSSPNKLWEYLSQQRDVISTPIPEAIVNSIYLSIAKDSRDYELLFSRLYLKDKFLMEKKMRGYVESKNRTWAKSTEYFSILIRQLINEL